MDLLCVYPEVTSILSRCVCIIAGAGWSPSGLLDLVTPVHAKNNTPSSCGMAILLGISSLLHSRVLAPHPDQLRDTDKKNKKLKPRQSDNLLVLMIKLLQSDPWRELVLMKPFRYSHFHLFPARTDLLTHCASKWQSQWNHSQVVDEQGCKTLTFTKVVLVSYQLLHLFI